MSSFTKKSYVLALILTVLLGPLGLLYASAVGGIILIVLAVVTFPTVIGPIAAWALAVLVGLFAVYRHNKGIDTALGVMSGREG